VHELLRVRDDELLARVGLDREHAGAEAIARVVLEQRGILPAVQEVLVGAPRRLPFDDLALLPCVAELHREARDRGAARQLDLEAALDAPRQRVLELEPQLGERQGPLHHRASVQAHQPQARAIGGGQRQGRRQVAAIGLDRERSRGQDRRSRGLRRRGPDRLRRAIGSGGRGGAGHAHQGERMEPSDGRGQQEIGGRHVGG
jgi:hypothetical protein